MKSFILSLGLLFAFFPDGLFSQIPGVPFIRALKDTIGMYEKFELVYDIKADYANPFDPDQIDVYADLKSPTGKMWKINGFFNSTIWNLRFAPNETGPWSYQLFIKDKNGVNDSTRSTFYVRPSSLKGPISVSQNKKYLQYANGDSYYGIGMWYNDGYGAFNHGQINANNLDELQKLGVNFISSFITPFETRASGLGRYDQSICGRLDEVLQLLEDRDMQLSLNIWFHAFLSETVWPGGNRRWNSNPYQNITSAKDFYRNEDAWKYQEKLYRYMIARYAHSKALMLWFVIDEVNGTDGWVSGDSIPCALWAQKVHDYIKANDPYHHLTTGTRSGGIQEYWHRGYQIFDLASREIYEAQGFPMIQDGKIDAGDEHPLATSYLNYANELDKLWQYNKPLILGETGWDHTFYEPSMPGYQAMYHNTIWISLAKGSAMSPFWWAYGNYLNDNIVTAQLRSLSRFAKEIPMAKLSNVSRIDTISGGKHAFAIASDQMTFGWVVNPDSDVTGTTVSLVMKNINRPSASYNTTYRIRIYHTWRAAFIYETTAELKDGRLTFSIPVLKEEGGHSNYMGQDAAFILEPRK